MLAYYLPPATPIRAKVIFALILFAILLWIVMKIVDRFTK